MCRPCLLLLMILLLAPLSAAVRQKPTPPLHCSHAVVEDAEGNLRAELRLRPRRDLDVLEVELSRVIGVDLAAGQPDGWRFENLAAGEVRTVILDLAAPAPAGALVFAYTTFSRGRSMGSGYRLPTVVTEQGPIPDDAL